MPANSTPQKKLWRQVLPVFTCSLVLTACGGGSSGGGNSAGGGDDNGGTPPPTTTTTPVSLTRDNTTQYAGATYDLVVFGAEHSVAWDQLLSTTLTNGSQTENCDGGGKVTLKISDGGRTVSEKYNNCGIYDQVSGSIYTANGQVVTTIDKSNPTLWTAKSAYSDYRITSPQGQKEVVNLDATIRYTPAGSDNEPEIDITLDGVVDSDTDGLLEVDAFRFSFVHDYGFANWYDSPITASGRLSYNRQGLAEVSRNEDGSLRLAGTGESFANIKFSSYSDGLNLSYYDAPDAPSAALYLKRDELLAEEISFFRYQGAYPVRISTYIPRLESQLADGSTRSPLQNWPVSLNVLKNFSDRGGQLLDFEVTVDSITPGPYPSDTNEGTDAYTLAYDQLGNITLTHKASGANYTYVLRVRAKNSKGHYVPQDLMVTVEFSGDHDGDLITDSSDKDDDNDGTEDYYDAFPYDDTEIADNDGDGLGDNQDSDDDNDNIADADDFYPFDANCHQQANGNGSDCWAQLIADLNSISAKNGVTYFYTSSHQGHEFFQIILPYTWSTGTFGEPLTLSMLQSNETIREIIPDIDNNRLMLVSSFSRLYAISAEETPQELGLIYEIPYEFLTSTTYQPDFYKVDDYWVAGYTIEELNSNGVERNVRKYLLLDSAFQQLDWFQGDPDYTWAYFLYFIPPHEVRLEEKGVQLDLTNLTLSMFEQEPVLGCSEESGCLFTPDPDNGDLTLTGYGHIYNQNTGILYGYLEGFSAEDRTNLGFQWKDGYIYLRRDDYLEVYEDETFTRVLKQPLASGHQNWNWHNSIVTIGNRLHLFQRLPDPNNPESWEFALQPVTFELDSSAAQ